MPRRIIITAFDGVEDIDVAGPASVFAGAARAAGGEAAVEIVISADAPRVRTAAGLVLEASPLPASAHDDLVLVPGGHVAVERGPSTAAVERWLSEAEPARLASVCTGAFIVARAGLLEGRRTTTHWAHADRLAREHPEATVLRDRLYVRDGARWSSGGATAGVEMALAMMADEVGPEHARTVGRWLLMDRHRPGDEPPSGGILWMPSAEDPRIDRVCRLLRGRPLEAHRAEDLAMAAGMSLRHFHRAFKAQTGMTASGYLRRLRLERAQLALRESDATIARVALECGFASPEAMRRIFVAAEGCSPAEYRRRHRPPGRGPRPDSNDQEAP